MTTPRSPDDRQFQALFPNGTMLETMSQAACWTRVSSVVTAARILQRRAPADSDSVHLAFPRDELLQSILIELIDYVTSAYRCPPATLALAARLDPLIDAATLSKLAAARPRPKIRFAELRDLPGFMPGIVDRDSTRVLQLVDAPVVIELIYEPLQMVRTLVVSLYREASKLRGLVRAAATETGSGPGIVHRHYADGALMASIDALIYFRLGFRVGVQWGIDDRTVERGFRCFNVVGRPPLESTLFEVARRSFAHLMTELGQP